MGRTDSKGSVLARSCRLLAALLAGVALQAGVAAGAGSGGGADRVDGRLDPRFGSGGIVSTAIAPNGGPDFQNGLAVDGRGRSLVSGSSDVGSGGGSQWRIARYTPQGQLDRSFGSGGTVLTGMSAAGGEDEHVWRLAVQHDGKIVAVGHAITPTGGEDFALARYLPDGRLDRSFGDGGRVFTAIGSGLFDDEAQAVGILADGKILVAGFAGTGAGTEGRDFALARYLPDGRLDRSYNRHGSRPGIVVTDIAGQRDQLKNMVIDSRGRAVAVGSATLGAGRGGTDFAVARYLPDGVLDRSFGRTGPHPGVAVTAMAPGDDLDLAEGVAIDRKERITVGGSADTGHLFDLALARYTPEGELDGTFGTGGKVLTNVGPGFTDDDLEGLVLQPNGKIIIGGSVATTEFLVDGDFLLARYEPNGNLDRSFGHDGFVRTSTAPGKADDEIFDIALAGAGKLIAAGECDQPATGRDVCLARYEVGSPH
ncbi:hypothetical protein ADK52_28575 [Streptomyces sp. WM6372]|uniref:hypothetical protein n=1 Tax=Streptomyces sp. WM6372 TaxID=1415555 RepID=UPI0006AE8734|nr:hypothetical protein [Streptomyces sp. WM6372]KOU19465.1 hypothetical protein ADK52_28575 [Streptomyces sp. WM6372]